MGFWRYDVFVSFRGEDTRNSFTGHLYEALVQAGINTFRDTEELNRGKEISKELCEAIDGSRFFLVVFSKNYASSSWCLDELVRIMSCMEQEQEQMVWPVFYDVDPSQVRNQKGIFGEVFDLLYEQRFKQDLDKVERWRRALTKAANLSGKHLDNGSESTLVREIVEEISTKLNRTLLTVAKNPVGIDSHIKNLKSTLDIESNDVRMIGIYGFGGIGKTTLAKAVYNLVANRFEACSFLPNIKEQCNPSMHDGLVKLQESLLQDILLDKKHWSINFVDRGTSILRDRLRMKKVLIVLDDVDNIFHLEKLAGNADWFGPGSRVIITTRNKQLLSAHGIDLIYKVDRLNSANSLELFCWNAFKKPHPVVNFEELSNVAVSYAAGHPLALIVVGASLCSCDQDVWKSQLKKLEMIPNKDVHEILKLSFDGLEDHEKEIFLDIACFFRENDVQLVMSFLDSCGFFAKVGIDVLVKKCLISVGYKFGMHDLIQLMGREIVRQESPNNPGQRSRLWFHEDILQVLNENEGTNKVQGILLSMPKEANKVSLRAKGFSRMKKLRLLIIYNVNVIGTPRYLSNELRWLECRGSSSYIVPSNFHPKNLVVIDISHYPFKQLGAGVKGFENIRRLRLEDCEMLTEIGDISLMPNLVWLEVINCFNLDSFSNGGLKSKALEFLSLKSCCKLKKFPDILEEMGRLQTLSLEETGVIELPTSVEKLSGLQGLILDFCENLVHLPTSIYMLKRLHGLKLSNCFKLKKITPPPSNSSFDGDHHIDQDFVPINLWSMDLKYSSILELDFIMIFNCFDTLNHLYLSGSKIRRLPEGMSKFKQLRSIDLSNCKHLQHIPLDLPPIIQNLDATGCVSLPKLDVTNVFDVDILSTNGYLCQDWKEVLLYQGICKDIDVRLSAPGNEIPNSFECCSASTGYSLMLQLPLHMKKHVAGIMVGVVYNMKNCYGSFEVQMKGVDVLLEKISPLSGELDHLHISYLPRKSSIWDEVLRDNNTSDFDVTLVQFEKDQSGEGEPRSWVQKFGIRLIFDEETYFCSRNQKRKRM